MRKSAVTLAVLALSGVCATFAAYRSEPVDSFRVTWQRPATAGIDERPLFICPKTALNHAPARETLSHPIVADALNTLFRPELSEAPGDVLRITAPDGVDLAAPVRLDAGVGPLLRAMEQSLRRAKRDVPEYLSLVADEYAPAQQETARFAVTCYWKGEQKLGALPGVISTRTGSLDGDELVEVRFDPSRIARETLTAEASLMSCYRGERSAEGMESLDDSNQQQYHLWLHKSWHFVPLTRLQATRVNAALVSGQSPERFLSPAQVEVHCRLQRALDRDRSALDALGDLNVDRSPEGINTYAHTIADRVRSW